MNCTTCNNDISSDETYVVSPSMKANFCLTCWRIAEDYTIEQAIRGKIDQLINPN